MADNVCVCVCVEGAFDNLVAITVRDVNSGREPTPVLDRHTGCAVIIRHPYHLPRFARFPAVQHCACAQG
jgi:hypothetical protein